MSAANEPPLLNPGDVFGSYIVTRRIGEGGMGAVYEGVHGALKKRVAIKTLHREYAQNPGVLNRFLREGQAAAKIRHPHVVDIVDVGNKDGIPYLVMEFLEGEDLAGLLGRAGCLPVNQIADIMLPVCAGIAAAHDEQIIHRDLKPENLFLARTRDGNIHPTVVDFGISKMDDPGAHSKTSAEVLMGTAYYMSPEQARGAGYVDTRSDAYALGVILYQCATGRRPFEGDSLYAVLLAIATAEVIAPIRVRPDLPVAFSDLVMRAMHRDPAMRYQTVRALGAALLPFAGEKARVVWSNVFAADGPVLPPEESAGRPLAAHSSNAPPVRDVKSSESGASATLTNLGLEVGRTGTLSPPLTKKTRTAMYVTGVALVAVAIAAGAAVTSSRPSSRAAVGSVSTPTPSAAAASPAAPPPATVLNPVPSVDAGPARQASAPQPVEATAATRLPALADSRRPHVVPAARTRLGVVATPTAVTTAQPSTPAPTPVRAPQPSQPAQPAQPAPQAAAPAIAHVPAAPSAPAVTPDPPAVDAPTLRRIVR